MMVQYLSTRLFDSMKPAGCCFQVLQPDMWGIVPSNRHDWSTLRADIKQYGSHVVLFHSLSVIVFMFYS